MTDKDNTLCTPMIEKMIAKAVELTALDISRVLSSRGASERNTRENPSPFGRSIRPSRSRRKDYDSED